VGHTIPAGTQVSITDASGNVVPFQVLYDVIVPGGSNTTAAGGVTLSAVTAGAAASAIGSPGGSIALIDALAFVNTITQVAGTTGGVDAETDDEYLSRLSNELQTLSPTPILAADFAILAQNVAGVQRAVAVDNYNPAHNFLTANEASAETDASGWTNSANTTIASTAAQHLDGAKSVQMTAASAATMSMINAASKTIVPGDTITAVASFRSAVTPRVCNVGIQWRDAGDAIISGTFGANVNDTTTGWTQAFCTAVAPATAVKCRILTQVTTPANAEVHYVDNASLRRGDTTDWVPGGTVDVGNQRMVAVYALDSTGTPVGGTVKTAISTYLQSLREVNFIVNVADPVKHEIDVTVAVSTIVGYSTTDVAARIKLAIEAFLNPAAWGIATSDNPNDPITWNNTPTINRLALGAAIQAVTGVNQITTLTLGPHGGSQAAADYTMGDVAPVPFTVDADLTVTAT
jgi:uncharacterized phage protein gp47/JayE